MQATLEILNRFYGWKVPESVEVKEIIIGTGHFSKKLRTTLVAEMPSPSERRIRTHHENIDGVVPRNHRIITWEGQEVRLVIPKGYWKLIGDFRSLINKLYEHNFEIRLKIDRKGPTFWAYKRYPGSVFRTTTILMLEAGRKPAIMYEAVLRDSEILGTTTPKELLENTEFWKRLEEEPPSREDVLRYAQINKNAVLTQLENVFKSLKADYVYCGNNDVFAEFGRTSVSTKLNSTGGIPTWVEVRIDGILAGELYLDAGAQVHWDSTFEAIKKALKKR